MEAGPEDAWALLLLPLPARPLLRGVLNRSGHGELLLLFGVAAALVASTLFEATGIEGGVGALAVGMLLACGGKADELSKTMLGLKDLYLVLLHRGVIRILGTRRRARRCPLRHVAVPAQGAGTQAPPARGRGPARA